MAKEKSNTLLKIAIYGGTLLFFLLQWFGPGLIKQYKQNKENELITFGGSKSEAERTSLNHNKSIKSLSNLTDSVIKNNSNIYVYTNDETMQLCKVYPNLNYDVFDPVTLGYSLISRNKSIIKEITAFAKNQDSLGYDIQFQDEQHQFKIKQLTNNEDIPKYILLTFYYFSDKVKRMMTTHIEKKPKRQFVYPYESKEIQLKKLDELQSSKIILTETELENQKIESNFRALMGPRKGSISADHKFYFAAYNKHISEEKFNIKIKQFVTLFMKKQNATLGTLKKIELQNGFSVN
ncbi:hypothetical protein JBL43_16425 [Aureibaculum sp. A20]|uniref:Uncharacterized protein n=1 Tax=Aureibaculum flavum TaxID=2795986 RepID=A0ABS0WV26_9FLAO|nr:hypothetical protein [Aureibaculum flavum]MBJ2175841.1 hypothetical protein [Aureibaculum flavum]